MHINARKKAKETIGLSTVSCMFLLPSGQKGKRKEYTGLCIVFLSFRIYKNENLKASMFCLRYVLSGIISFLLNSGLVLNKLYEIGNALVRVSVRPNACSLGLNHSRSGQMNKALLFSK